MSETFWVDVSEHNGSPVNNRYLLWSRFSGWFSFRCLDGTYKDQLCAQNLRWVDNCKKLIGFIVYIVYPPSETHANAGSVFRTFMEQVGKVHRPRMVVMIDVESWNGFVTGDHSGDVNSLRYLIAGYLFSLRPAYQRKLFAVWFRRRDLMRVIVYGNVGDLQSIVPKRFGARVLLADYSNPKATFPGKIAEQYTSTASVAPWPGNVDVNYSPVSPRKLAQQLGLGTVRWALR